MARPDRARPGPCPVRAARRQGAPRVPLRPPADAKPWLDDRRRLGVRVRRLALRHDATLIPIALDDPALGAGWWPAESDAATQGRWTDGDAELPPLAAPALLDVDISGSLAYLAEAPSSTTSRIAAATRSPATFSGR